MNGPVNNEPSVLASSSKDQAAAKVCGTSHITSLDKTTVDKQESACGLDNVNMATKSMVSSYCPCAVYLPNHFMYNIYQ